MCINFVRCWQEGSTITPLSASRMQRSFLAGSLSFLTVRLFFFFFRRHLASPCGLLCSHSFMHEGVSSAAGTHLLFRTLSVYTHVRPASLFPATLEFQQLMIYDQREAWVVCEHLSCFLCVFIWGCKVGKKMLLLEWTKQGNIKKYIYARELWVKLKSASFAKKSALLSLAEICTPLKNPSKTQNKSVH